MASSNVKYKAKDGTLISLTTKIINNTTSTSTTDALSAAQGKILNDEKAASKVLAVDTDLDTVKTPGIYSCGGGNSIKNKPSGLDAIGLIVVHNASGEYYTQILTTNTNASTYRRICANGTWNAWTIDKYTDTTYTKSSLGLGNVDNTADANKSVKYATSAGSAGSVAWGNVSGKPSTFTPASHTHAKSEVGLGNVDNTADSAKSVKYATSAGSASSATTASKLGSATVGSASTPIYLNGGTATACTDVPKKPIYSTTDLTAGSSGLATGQLYLVYE